MTVELIKRWGGSDYLERELQYGTGWITRKDKDLFEIPHKYYGYRLPTEGDSTYICKLYLFARVKGTEEWRRATDPKEIRGQLGILAFTNPVVYLLTTVKRVAEVVSIVARFFFDMFADLYSQKTIDNLTRAFIAGLSNNLKEKKKECRELWDAVKNDFYCASGMELAAIHGILNSEDATRMQFLFGDTERQWNRYKKAEAFKHIEIEETPLYGVSLFSSKWYKTADPLLWTFMVNKSTGNDSEELEQMIRENGAYTGAMEESSIKWLENAVDHLRGARVKPRDIELLREVIEGDPKFQAMNIRELASSSRLKFLFLSNYFVEIAKMTHSGFIQYQCAYPLSVEKQGRIEVFDKTIDDSITESWEKFAPGRDV